MAFVAGNNQADTIGAVLPQMLVVRISHSAGFRLRQAVAFYAANDSGPQGAAPGLLVSKPSQNSFVQALAESTNTDGEASVQIDLGLNAGPTSLVAVIPALNLTDTARFTVQPGGLVSVHLSPQDTAIHIGGSITYRGAGLDRAGNTRGDSVSFSAPSGPLSAGASPNVVTGTAIGRGFIVGRVRSVVDTAFVSVVPPGTLAATQINGTGMVMFDLDGSNLRVISTFAGEGLAWSPSGSELAFSGYEWGIGITDTLGNIRVGAAVPSGDFLLDSPIYSSNGQWLYFTNFAQTVISPETPEVWRVSPTDTSTATAVVVQNFAREASPSPDGTRLAIVDGYSPNHLEIYDTVSKTLTALTTQGAVTPSWSPTGTVIAYVAEDTGASEGQGPLRFVNADGTNDRLLTGPASSYESDFTWSPDGSWIVARNLTTGVFDVISASTGAALPLAFTSTYFSPAWRPTGQSAAARRAQPRAVVHK